MRALARAGARERSPALDVRLITSRSLLYLALVVMLIVSLFPFYWAFVTAVKADAAVFAQPPQFLPSSWHWENFARAMSAEDFPRFFLNSFVISVVVAGAQIILASTAGYAFARLHFRGRDVLFTLVVATMMVPFQVTMVPLFIMAKQWPLLGGNNLLGQGGTGMLDSYWGLTVPMFAAAWGTFLLRQFFQSLPVELEDAARIDGCSELGIYRRIVLPLSGPALATLGIFSFQNVWNDFIWPFIIVKSDAMKTVQIGLLGFQRENSTEWTLLMAATLLATLPVVAIFLLGQRYFTQGIALTGLKG